MQSVVDTVGNTYQLAAGPTVRAGFATQTIYYAANIAPAAASFNTVTVTFDGPAIFADIRIAEYQGLATTNPVDVVAAGQGNTVTVTFSQPAVYADIRIAEYQGLATANPVDAVSAGQGNDTSSDSGRAITTSANDLLVGANTVRTRTMDPGAGFTPRAITSPDGDLLEDRIVTAAGSYNTTAPLSSPGDWIMQMVAFRAASADALPPTGVTDKTGVAPPTVVAEARFAVDSPGPARADLSLDVNGANTLLLVALHAEFDGGDTNWSTQDNGVPGALLVNTDGYNGGAGNQRFRIYYWVNPPAGTNAIVVQNSYQGPNELAVSAVLLSNVAPGAPFGAMALDVSSTPRTSESETVATNTGDLVVHVIADALFTRGTLGGGETSVSVANDGGHTAPGDGDASLWISTKPGADAGTTVSSSGWADSPSPSPRVINGVAIVVHGSGAVVDTPTPVTDVQPPSAPGTLAATVLGGTQIGLSWGPATDNAGVTAYVIQRCQGAGCMNFATLAASTTTRFSDTGLTPGTTYAYVVFAKDAANNVGPTSNVASAMTALIDPTLVAAFAFDEGSGLTVIDASGHGNTGTIANATWTSGGKYGNALSFDGTSSRVTIDDAASLRLTTGMTLEAWVNPSTASSRWRDINYRGADSFYLDTYNSAPVAGLTLTPSTNSNTFGFAALPLNTWTHLAETFDGSNVTLFVNGVQVATTPIAGSLLDSTDPLEIGSDHIFGQYFRGLIDEVRVYNVALTADQIQTDMVTPVGTAAP
jgi:hypothetical protein